MSQIGTIDYVNREDIKNDFEEEITQILETENHIMVGFPGTGKSTSAKSILAHHIQKGKPGIYFKIDRTLKNFQHSLELVSINNQKIVIPIVQIPFASTDQEKILNSTTISLKKLHKKIENISKLTGKTGKIEEYQKVLGEEFELIKNIFGDHATHVEEITEYTKIISESLPYVTSALKLCQGILKIKQKHDLSKIQNNELLIIVDDLEDLNPNWLILQKLLESEFRFLFVLRIEDPNDYLSLNTDRLYITKYLEKMGIPLSIPSTTNMQLPSLEIFSQIMKHNGVDEDSVLDLWNYSGGLPATGLMIFSNLKLSNKQEFFNKVEQNLVKKSINLSWKVDDIEKRITYTLYFVKIIFDELKSRNYGYLPLIVQPHGVSQEELLLFHCMNFEEVYTNKDQNMRNVLQLFQSNLEKIAPNLKIIDKVDTQSKHPCVLDDEFTENFDYAWYTEEFNPHSNELIKKELPALNGSNGSSTVYRFTPLFQHVGTMMPHLEKSDSELHEELERIRIMMIRVHTEISKITGGFSTRLGSVMAYHITKIEDYSEVHDEIALWFSRILMSQFSLVYTIKDLENVVEKIILSNQNSIRTLSFLCYNLSRLFQYSNKPNDWILKKIGMIIKQIQIPNDRLSQLSLALTLTTFEKIGFDSIPGIDELHLNSEHILTILDKQTDSLSLFAKVVVYSESAETYFAGAKYSLAKAKFEEIDQALKKLNTILQNNPESLNWMNEFQIIPNIEILVRKAKFDSIMGTLYFYYDQLDACIEKYNSSIESWKMLHNMEGYVPLQEAKLVSKLLKDQSDDSTREILLELADNDKDLFNENKQKILLGVPPPKITGIHVKSIIARRLLDKIYQIKTTERFEPKLFFELWQHVLLESLTEVLNKCYTDKFCIEEIISLMLALLVEQPHIKKRATYLLMLFWLEKENLRKTTIADKEISFESVEKLLTNEPGTYELNLEFQYMIGNFENKIKYGRLIDEITKLCFEHGHVVSYLFLITVHLLHNELDVVKLMLVDLFEKQPQSSKLLKRVSRDLRIVLQKIDKNSLNTCNEQLKKEFILNYLRLFLFFY